jgi:hypothetical protein
MATWHQMQARKRPGFKLFDAVRWTALHDPPGNMASAMLFDTYSEATAYRERCSPEFRRHVLVLPPDRLTWLEVDEARYDEMLNILPPVIFGADGFLVGEAWDHDPIRGLPRFAAFVRADGKYWEATLPMSAADFRVLDLRTMERRPKDPR